MPHTLVINHHSLPQSGYLCNSPQEGFQVLRSFFKTWQHAIQTGYAEQVYIGDTEIWQWQPSPDTSLHEFKETLGRDAQLFLARITARLTKMSSTDVFADGLLEMLLQVSPAAGEPAQEVFILGGAAQMADFCALSLNTAPCWRGTSIFLSWYTDNTWKVKAQVPHLSNTLPNIANAAHVDFHVKDAAKNTKIPVLQSMWNERLPSTVLTDSFWDWFSCCTTETQHFLLEKTEFCQQCGWQARGDSPYKNLQGTRNGLSEIRVWPVGTTLRIYVKQETPARIILLSGSDHDAQDTTIKKADALYDAYQEK